MSLTINFDNPQDFEPRRFSSLNRVCGLYFIFLPQRKIAYPFKDSRLIYIGMSEKVTNSIASRLSDHYDGRSGNFGLKNYRSSDDLKFTYLNFEIVRPFWTQRVEDFESAFILNFVKKFGVYPICNNKTGFPDFSKNIDSSLEVDWSYFD